MLDIKRLQKGFWQVADPKIWIASTIPLIVGAAASYYSTNSFNWIWFFVSVAGIYLIEIGKNAINECVDYKSGVDLFVTPDKRTPFSGGKKAIVDKNLTFNESAVIGFLTTGAAVLVGLTIVFFREFNVLWIGITGIFLAVFYSLPPLKFCYRGIGEFVVGITFGPLITLGIYLVETKTFSLLPVIAGISTGFIIANVLLINEFPDYEADKKGSKKNLVVRFGKKNSVIIYALFFEGSFISTITLALYEKNPVFLLPLLTIPFVFKSVKNAKINYDNIPELIKSNAATIIIYQLTGVFMVAAFIAAAILKNYF